MYWFPTVANCLYSVEDTVNVSADLAKRTIIEGL